jgi:hypothetical protein
LERLKDMSMGRSPWPAWDCLDYMSTNASAVGETTSLQAGNESCALAICRIYRREMNVGPGDGRWVPRVFQSGTAPFKGCSGLKEEAGLWDNDTWQDTKQCCGRLKIFGVVNKKEKLVTTCIRTKPLAKRTLAVVIRMRRYAFQCFTNQKA